MKEFSVGVYMAWRIAAGARAQVACSDKGISIAPKGEEKKDARAHETEAI